MADQKDDDKPPLKEDDVLARLKGGPGQPPTGVTSFVGLLGRGAKEGSWLLYLSLDMSRCIEVSAEDVVHSEPLAPERSPFGSLGGTRLFVKKDAKVVTTQSTSRTRDAQQAADEFDLDIRLGARRSAAGYLLRHREQHDLRGSMRRARAPATRTPASRASAVATRAFARAATRAERSAIRPPVARVPGRTRAGTPPVTPARRAAINRHAGRRRVSTCRTNCGTCETCQTQCGQRTCQTCRTDCGTCPSDTCQACTHVTCFRTCDACG